MHWNRGSWQLAGRDSAGPHRGPDQIIDKTYTRASTFFENGIAAYPGFAEPYCPNLRKVIVESLQQHFPGTVHSNGTYVCMEGPALSTKAESLLHRSWGAHLIGMTASPEAKLAREAEISYANVSMVTDYDCWKRDEGTVNVPKALAILKDLSTSLQRTLPHLISNIANAEPSEIARDALKTALISDPAKLSHECCTRLAPILERYLPKGRRTLEST